MRNRVGRPRGVLIVVAAVVALAAAGGDVMSAGQAGASELTALPSTADSAYAETSSSKRQRKAKVVISGSVTKQSACQDQLLASVVYTKRDGKVDSAYAVIDDGGAWSVTIKGLKAGTFKAAATLVGHPRDGLLKWSESSTTVKRGKRTDLGEVKIRSCED